MMNIPLYLNDKEKLMKHSNLYKLII